ncbi:MAG: TIGR02677 family protein, partial [Clostridia bacterium]|nr:TIGR02677 family protein [Clostridia bacterium]
SIMRILYYEKESYHAQMSTNDILTALQQYKSFATLSMEKLKAAMQQLTNWGCVSPLQDPRSVRTIEEYLNKVYRYSLTEDAVMIERMTLTLEHMFSEGTTLSSSLLVRINHDLRNISSVVNEKSNKDLNEWWRNLQEDFKRLSKNYNDYIHSFCSTNGEKWLNSVAFLEHKDRFIEYLRDFITQLQRYSIQIENNLKKLSPATKETLFRRLIESEAEIPRTTTERASMESIENNIINDWNALYTWFVSANGKEAVCSYAMEYTNQIISKMVNNAILLMQLQNTGISKKHEYRHYMEMFAQCETIEDAHCLSAHAFGVMNIRHYQYHTDLETDSIFENAADLAPQQFIIKPITRSYQPRIKTAGVSMKTWEKSISKRQKLAQLSQERDLITSYIKENRLSLADLAECAIPSTMRTHLLKWITIACQNPSRTGLTDFGKRFRLLSSAEKVTLHFEDGDLVMPAYTFEFEGEQNE